VIIDAGWGDFSAAWSEVQAGVAISTRVCTYDRAGMGYSDAGPLPRDAAQFVKELHTLLQRADIPGPYVMVGHSLGGIPVRLYVHEYPSEVAGVVLIDSMNPAQSTATPEQRAAKPSSEPGGPSIPALLARIGVMRLLLGANDAYGAYSVTPRSAQAVFDEGAAMTASFEEAAAVKTFGDLPLIVLSRGKDDQEGWPEWQAELLQLSSDSEQLIAEGSGHSINHDNPQAAIDAIVKMVLRIRAEK
jgi:pimeloyl-ACP methyl ester carboxylesterase